MCSIPVFLTVLLLELARPGTSLELRNGAYEDLVVAITDSVPTTDCHAILNNLETTLTSASGYLFSALDGRAYLHGTSVILPESWPDSCLPRGQRTAPHTGDKADITILPTADDPRGKLWTQQSAGCGQQGDGIFLGWEGLVKRDDTLFRNLIKEFAMYRYGVFEEQGYVNDPIHPMCYFDDQNKKAKITGCSDEPINDLGICDSISSTTSAIYNTTRMVSPQARSSILFAAEAPNISMFCDKFTHDKHAPTKHNLLCGRQSTLDVIMQHNDFKGAKGAQGEQGASSEIRNTQPRLKYVRQTVTRYVLVIENTSDMLRRESWQFLRAAIRKWVYDLPANAEVGLVMTNDTGSLKLLKLRSMINSNNRDSVASEIPYSPSDSSMQPCLHCAMREALDMLGEKARLEGAGTGVIVTIATGMNYNSNLQSIIKDCKKAKVKIATINYPAIVRSDLLDILATETNGVAFTVLEKKANVQSTLLSTYFQLTNVLYNIMEKFYAGNKNDLPMEIHRREIKDDGRSSITGSFVLDENMGEPAKFILYTYNINVPLIKSVKLTSPSLKEYTTRSDNMLMVKMITLNTNLTETGTWTYTIEPFIGNPQPHFLQVMASPLSPTAPMITARFWTHQNVARGPVILLTEVKYGDYPVLGAKVEAIIRKSETNGSVIFIERLDLLDSGSGDPDITKADGVYSRYFSAMNGGAGVYTFEVTVSDNGNTAYTWVKDGSTEEDTLPCCGSKIPSRNVAPISPFQRVLPTKTISFTPDDIDKANEFAAGRIGDLRVDVIPEDKKARLSWTAPDMGGHNVARYEIKYAYTIDDITDHFQLNAIEWSLGRPFPLAAGSDTAFTLDMSQDTTLLDKPLYFAIKSFANTHTDTTPQLTSNIVRVFVPSPLPPPTVIPPYTGNTHDTSNWPYLTSNGNNGDISSGPAVAKSANIGLELILPIVIGAIVLMVILILYCYCCVVKRRGMDRGNMKAGSKSGGDKHNMQSTITIVPSSPAHAGYGQQQHIGITGSPEMHTIGVPTLTTPTHNQHMPAHYTYTNPQSPSIIDSDSSDKKRYSLIHPLESQLIDDLKAHHHQHHQQQQQYNVSVIGNNGNNQQQQQQQQATLPRQNNGLQQQTLSPYNSWSASQLLHEHERRHSPNMTMEEVMAMDDQWKNGGGQQVVMLDGGHQLIIPDQYSGQTQTNPQHIPPPVPPLPLLAPSYQSATNYNQSSNGYAIYGTNPNQQQQQQQTNNQSIYQTMHRTNDQSNGGGGMSAVAPPSVNGGNYNPQGSLQGSLTSVNSGDKKRRNVTMV